jgi:hypothetical protein
MADMLLLLDLFVVYRVTLSSAFASWAALLAQVIPGVRPPYWAGCDFNASTQTYSLVGAVNSDDAWTHANNLVRRESMCSPCESKLGMPIGSHTSRNFTGNITPV